MSEIIQAQRIVSKAPGFPLSNFVVRMCPQIIVKQQHTVAFTRVESHDGTQHA